MDGIDLVKSKARNNREAGKTITKSDQYRIVLYGSCTGWLIWSVTRPQWFWATNDPAKKQIRRLEEIDASVRGKAGEEQKERNDNGKGQEKGREGLNRYEGETR